MCWGRGTQAVRCRPTCAGIALCLAGRGCGRRKGGRGAEPWARGGDGERALGASSVPRAPPGAGKPGCLEPDPAASGRCRWASRGHRCWVGLGGAAAGSWRQRLRSGHVWSSAEQLRPALGGHRRWGDPRQLLGTARHGPTRAGRRRPSSFFSARASFRRCAALKSRRASRSRAVREAGLRKMPAGPFGEGMKRFLSHPRALCPAQIRENKPGGVWIHPGAWPRQVLAVGAQPVSTYPAGTWLCPRTERAGQGLHTRSLKYPTKKEVCAGPSLLAVPKPIAAGPQGHVSSQPRPSAPRRLIPTGSGSAGRLAQT